MILIKSFDTDNNNSYGNSEKILFNKFLAFQIFFPLLGGFLFGYNTGVISGALLLLKMDYKPNVLMQEIIVTSTIFAAAISSMIGGLMAERFGRKITLITSSVYLTIGAVVMGASNGVITVIVGRCIIGVGIAEWLRPPIRILVVVAGSILSEGLASTSCPIYIAEVAPEEIRGRLILLYQGTIAGGQFLASLFNALFNYSSSQLHLWRFMLGFPAIIALIQGFGLVFIPESHRWLILNNKIQKAEEIIKKEGRIQKEFINEYIKNICYFNEESILSVSQNAMRERNILYQMLYNKTVRRSLFIGCVIQTIGQIVGINGVIYYSSSIINMAGITDVQTVLWYTVLVMFFCFIPLIIGFFLIDRIGRKKLAIGSLVGIFLSTIIIAVGFQIMSNKSDPVTQREAVLNDFSNEHCSYKANCEDCVTIHTCGYCHVTNTSLSYCLKIDENQSNVSDNGWCTKNNVTSNIASFKVGFCTSIYSMIIIIGMALYLMSFNIGMGPIPWIVTSEIYPPWSRSISMAISTTINWTFNIIISMFFLTLTELITRYGTFWLFGGISCFGILLIYVWLIETNKKTLEEITLMMEGSRINI